MAQYLAGHPAQVVLPEPPRAAGGWLWSGAATNTAFAGPWGISYAINLTPDNGTGIGLWTEQVFVNALKTGRHMGVGRTILPPMPWPAYAEMTDQDVRAIYAYLRTIDAKVNKVPPSASPSTPPPAPPRHRRPFRRRSDPLRRRPGPEAAGGGRGRYLLRLGR